MGVAIVHDEDSEVVTRCGGQAQPHARAAGYFDSLRNSLDVVFRGAYFDEHRNTLRVGQATSLPDIRMD
jgi:hypothetical protein